jgi:hypothetical protein
MSKLMTSSAKISLSLVRDAFGNGISGNEERSLRYLKLASDALRLHVSLLEDRNNPRIEKDIRTFHSGLNAQLDAFPPFDGSRIEECRRGWDEKGIESSTVLPQLDPSALPAQNGKPGANVVSLEGDQLKVFLEAVQRAA